jgi:hypothetical protein
MSALPGQQPPRRPDELVPEEGDVRMFARIEGLVGEEAALIAIPADQRTGAQHDRLRALTEELDRIWEKLRERAERIGRHPAHGAAGA